MLFAKIKFSWKPNLKHNTLIFLGMHAGDEGPDLSLHTVSAIDSLQAG